MSLVVKSSIMAFFSKIKIFLLDVPAADPNRKCEAKRSWYVFKVVSFIKYLKSKLQRAFVNFF